MDITTQAVAFTAEGTLLEVLRMVDVKDSIAPVRLRFFVKDRAARPETSRFEQPDLKAA